MTSLRCYFSFRSPFAAIALYRLRRLREFADIDIELMPVWPDIMFGGHIDNPTDNVFKMAYIFGDAARQAELAGLDRTPFDQLAAMFELPEKADYRSEKVGVSLGEENWEPTHKAFLFARQQDKGWAFADAVCVRRFNLDGQGTANVMNPDVIAALSAEVGLEGEAVLAAISDAAIDEEMNRIIARSEADGVFGVPFFVLEKGDGIEKFWGNDRLEHVLMCINGAKVLPNLPQVFLPETCRN